MNDRTQQQSDRPGRKVFTGLAIAAGGGVIALLVEYFVLQGAVAPETKTWDSNVAPRQVDGVSADGEIEHANGRLRVTGDLRDKRDDNRGVLLSVIVDGRNHRTMATTKGLNESAAIDENVPDSVKTVEVRECLTHPKKSAQDHECSDPLVIWP